MSLLTRDVHTFGGRQHSPHIPVQPFWLLIIRVVQLLFALITLALSAYCISLYSGYYYVPNAFGMNIFTSIYTFIFLGYILISAFFAPSIYHMWAHLVLECLAVLWWLVSWALQADWASFYGNLNFGNGDSVQKSAYGATAADAALGAINWLLFVASLVWLSLQIHRIRIGGRTETVSHTGPTKLEPMGAHSATAAPASQQYVPTGHPETQQPSTYAAPNEQYGAAPEPTAYGAPAAQHYAGEAPAAQPYGGVPAEQQHQHQQNMA